MVAHRKSDALTEARADKARAPYRRVESNPRVSTRGLPARRTGDRYAIFRR